MNLISEIHDKTSERTVSNAVAGYVVPITALGLSSLFDTMKKKKVKNHEPIVDLEGEIWKPVIGYEGLYEVSNLGRVKSLNYRSHSGVHRIMQPLQSRSGYLTVGLTKNNKKETKQIHRLVYEAFVKLLPEYSPTSKKGDEIYEINHIDEDKTNNKIENLELVSHTENVNHGTAKKRIRMKLMNGKKSKKVYQYSIDGEFIRLWDSIMECHRNGFEKSNVNACCLNKRNHCYGFIWSYCPLTVQECIEKKSKSKGKVYQFDIDGNLIKIWDNAGQCNKNGFSNVCVRRCCLNKQFLHKGFFWSARLLSKKEIELKKDEIFNIKNNRRKKIYQYSTDNTLIKIWESEYECMKNGFNLQNISSCCRGKRKFHRGYIWSFKPLEK